MTNIADKLVSYAVANNSTLAQKFFSDKRKVFNTEILDNHVYVNLPKSYLIVLLLKKNSLKSVSSLTCIVIVAKHSMFVSICQMCKVS